MEPVPEGEHPDLIVEAVEWLPSGGGSGLVRVRGRWRAGTGADVPPPLVVAGGSGAPVRHDSLPDPRALEDPGVWRGAYIVRGELVEDGRPLALELPDGQLTLPAATVVRPAPEPTAEPSVAPSAGGEVIDRGVLVERRARRVEAVEEAQARIAHEALDAVEGLERREAGLERQVAELTAERDALAVDRLEAEVTAEALEAARGQAARSSEALGASKGRVVALEEERVARLAELQALRSVLATTLVELDHLRLAAEVELEAHVRAEAESATLRARLETAAADAVTLTGRLAVREEARRGAMARVATVEAERDAARAEVAALKRRSVGERVAALERRPAASAEDLAGRAAALGPRPSTAPSALVDDLDRAAAALRAARPEPPAAAGPGPTVSPQVTAVDAEPTGEPWLRGALVRAAHDEPLAAARILVGLLPAQAKLLGPGVTLDYDLVITELGAFAVTVAGGAATVRPLDRPRGRRRADFRLRGSAFAFAELLAGRGRRPGRLGGSVRLSGRRARRARVLDGLPARVRSLVDAVRAGAHLEPGDVLATLPYVVDPAWTRGCAFTIAQEVRDHGSWVIGVADGAALTVQRGPVPGAPEPDATVTFTRGAFDALLRREPSPPGDRPRVRGDRDAVAQLKAWTDRVLGDPPAE